MNKDIAKGVFRIERLTSERIQDLRNLYAIVYGTTPSLNYFEKKYDTAYTGVMYTGFIAYDEKNPVAYYGVIPTFLCYKDGTILAAQSCDTMTHPAYRGRGLFMQLFNCTAEICRKEGVKLLFGFPNQNSHPGFIKLGWKTTERMELFSLPVRTIPIEGLVRRFPFFKTAYQRYTNLVLKRYFSLEKGLLQTFEKQYGGIKRDESYLQYKTYSSTGVLCIAGAKVWVKWGSGLSIGDVEVAEVNFDLLIKKLKKLVQRLGVRTIFFHVSPGTLTYDLFQKRHESVPSFPVIFYDLGCGIPLEKIKFTFADIDIF